MFVSDSRPTSFNFLFLRQHKFKRVFFVLDNFRTRLKYFNWFTLIHLDLNVFIRAYLHGTYVLECHTFFLPGGSTISTDLPDLWSMHHFIFLCQHTSRDIKLIICNKTPLYITAFFLFFLSFSFTISFTATRTRTVSSLLLQNIS